MTTREALDALLFMAEHKVKIMLYAVTDPNQRAALLKEIKVLTWAAGECIELSGCLHKEEQLGQYKDLAMRQRALEKRFPLWRKRRT